MWILNSSTTPSEATALKIRLVGGLGNQLFQYFAGRYAARLMETELDLHLPESKNPPLHERSSILDFKLEEKLAKQSFSLRLLGAVCDHSSALPSPLYRGIMKGFSVCHCDELGFDPKLESVRANSFVVGNFQTYRYFLEDPIGTAGQNLELLEPSDWFLDLEKEAKRVGPAFIHVRRGDYALKRNRAFGMLSAQYFLSALKKLEEHGRLESQEIWVMSDDVSLAKQEFGAAAGRFRFIEPPYESKAAESLLLMTHGSAHVISNSTFSYWGALLSRSKNVISPAKWFLNSNDPKDLRPSGWLTHPSLWL